MLDRSAIVEARAVADAAAMPFSRASLQNKHQAGFQQKHLQMADEGEPARSGRRSTHGGLDADARRRIAQPIRAGLELQLDPALNKRVFELMSLLPLVAESHFHSNPWAPLEPLGSSRTPGLHSNPWAPLEPSGPTRTLGLHSNPAPTIPATCRLLPAPSCLVHSSLPRPRTGTTH